MSSSLSENMITISSPLLMYTGLRTILVSLVVLHSLPRVNAVLARTRKSMKGTKTDMKEIGRISGLVVETNGSEIFVSDTDNSNVRIRIGSRFKELIITA